MAPTALLPLPLQQGTTQGKLSSVPHTLWPFFLHKDIGLCSVYFSAQFTVCFKVEWVRFNPQAHRPHRPGERRPVAEDHSGRGCVAPPPGHSTHSVFLLLINSCQNRWSKNQKELGKDAIF